MSDRTSLPNRRFHETMSVTHWDIEWIIGIGRSGIHSKICELFINTGKSGTQVETVARDAAIILSIGLQYGVPLETFRNAVTRNIDGSPSGPVGKILDSIMQGNENGTTANNMDT